MISSAEGLEILRNWKRQRTVLSFISLEFADCWYKFEARIRDVGPTLRRLREIDRVCSPKMSHRACRPWTRGRVDLYQFGARQTASRVFRGDLESKSIFFWAKWRNF